MSDAYDLPLAEPDVAPFVVVRFNEEYLGYLVGFCERMSESAIFTGDDADNDLARQRFAHLAAVLAAEYTCP